MFQMLLKDTEATENFGMHLAAVLQAPMVVYLNGELGAGKTTLVRGFLRGLGFMDSVKSPTYTLVESYPFANTWVYHFDLYRILQASELEHIGIREYFTEKSIVFIEWPEKGEGYIPKADLQIELSPVSEGRTLKLELLSERALNFKKELELKCDLQVMRV